MKEGLEEFEDPDTQTMRRKAQRLCNNKTVEDLYFWDAWMSISFDAMVGADKMKDIFWRRIEEYYASHVEIPSRRTTDYLTHHQSASKTNAIGGSVALIKST